MAGLRVCDLSGGSYYPKRAHPPLQTILSMASCWISASVSTGCGIFLCSNMIFTPPSSAVSKMYQFLPPSTVRKFTVSPSTVISFFWYVREDKSDCGADTRCQYQQQNPEHVVLKRHCFATLHVVPP